MYGWRARIGHIAPSRGDTLVYEFYKMFPEGFMMLNTTGTVRQLVDSDFEAQLSRINSQQDSGTFRPGPRRPDASAIRHPRIGGSCFNKCPRGV